MLRQYFATKERHPGVLLAMRVGDFYEFYGEDAETAARALSITLTGREDGPNGRIPMAGVPFHSVEKYLAQLIRQGFKVALCDQVEDPKKAKGLVRREVTRVITPGTVLEESMLSERSNNFLASIAPAEGGAGIGFLDLSTGEFLVTQVDGEDAAEKSLNEVVRLNPAECLLPEEAEELYEFLSKITQAIVTRRKGLRPREAKERLLRQFGTQSLAPFGLETLDAATMAAGTILDYLDENELDASHIDHVVTYSLGDRMRMDAATLRSLELTSNIFDGGSRMTLLETLDHTKTGMGSRLLKRWIEEPLLDEAAINDRLDAVEGFLRSALQRDSVRDLLARLYDIQRLVGRCATAVANPRDLVALRSSLETVPELVAKASECASGAAKKAIENISAEEELTDLLKRAIVDDPPMTVREGGIIRPGHSQELDELRALSREGKTYIAQLEGKERTATGIDRLKIGYNSVFGYYLEVPKTQIAHVPDRYIRKQTTANAERYITAELKEFEAKVLGSEEKATELEYDLFGEIRSQAAARASSLLRTARSIAELDVFQSLAHVASANRYCRPALREAHEIDLKAARHPVVEAKMGLGSFVPNDVRLTDTASLIVLTGPNMSGKSTYLRQTAHVVLMAQIGSFVPAQSATLGITDRVFARIGARDEIATGQSTFMVEMTEAANILHHATERSLVILDEIGRGTSTFDGLAIAWAIAERLARVRSKTLFATHYHQLNRLAEQEPTVRNYRVAVREEGDKVIWLHKVLEGGTDRSYGIQVARMAGVPASVLERASEILDQLEGSEAAPAASRIQEQTLQMTLFTGEPPEVVKRLRSLDTSSLTPLEALVLLDNLKREYADKNG